MEGQDIRTSGEDGKDGQVWSCLSTTSSKQTPVCAHKTGVLSLALQVSSRKIGTVSNCWWTKTYGYRECFLTIRNKLTYSPAYVHTIYTKLIKPLVLPSVSLVPRPFPPPVFDHLQYANTEREGLGDLVTCDDVKQTDSGHMGDVAHCNNFCFVSKSFLCCEWWTVLTLLQWRI